MTIDKIASLSQTLATLRQAGKGLSPEAPAQSRQNAADAARQAGASRAELEQQIRARIGRINPDDPQRRRRALRAIVEVSLTNEFGPQLESDPAFHSIVDQTVQAMAGDAAIDAAVDVALKAVWP
jgi:hypothetical protein